MNKKNYIDKIELILNTSGKYITNKEKDMILDYVNYFKNKNNVIEDKNIELVIEIERLNNIINELKWKPINEYENPKYDWVLIKMFIKDDNFECIPIVAEKRFNHWYDANGYVIDEDLVEVKYFMDMQQIDKLQELKGDKNNDD